MSNNFFQLESSATRALGISICLADQNTLADERGDLLFALIPAIARHNGAIVDLHSGDIAINFAAPATTAQAEGPPLSAQVKTEHNAASFVPCAEQAGW